MAILLLLAGIDLLLPAVHIPAYAWAIILLTWVCYKAVLEAKPKKNQAVTTVEIYTPELDWVVSSNHDGVYSTTDGKWQLVKTPYEDKADVYVLFKDDDGTVIVLTASELSPAMDQADMLINILTPAGEEV